MSGLPPFLYLLSPQGIFAACCAVAFMCWIYIGWVLPIDTIRDKTNKKSKTPFIGLLAVVGILPIVIFLGSMYKSRGNNGNINGTSMNAMGPVPVVGNNTRGALPNARAPQPY